MATSVLSFLIEQAFLVFIYGAKYKLQVPSNLSCSDHHHSIPSASSLPWICNLHFRFPCSADIESVYSSWLITSDTFVWCNNNNDNDDDDGNNNNNTDDNNSKIDDDNNNNNDDNNNNNDENAFSSIPNFPNVDVDLIDPGTNVG